MRMMGGGPIGETIATVFPRMFLLLVGAYLWGSFPTGWVVIRLRTGEGIWRVGSGRTGGTKRCARGDWWPAC